jgi:ornithine cyclodeaminase
MRVIGLPEIREAATRPLVFDAVRAALIAHSEGRTTSPPPIHLAFPDVEGDCHVKVGHLTGSPHFTVKIASGFYRNEARGLPSNNGVVLVLNATTGVPAAVLADEGWLTAWRTAAAGALITHALTPPEIREVAVIGTGLQAQLQISWLHALRPLTRVQVWGRRPSAAERLAAALRTEDINAHAEQIINAPCVIAATAATTPPVWDLSSAIHVTGIGTDMPGKNELPPELFAAATIIATDDHNQCLDHGDFGNAVRAGHVAESADTPVGTVLREGVARTGLTIADLTGVGAADAAVASAVLTALDHAQPMPVQ